MQIKEFFKQCESEFRNFFRESMGFTIQQLTSERDDYLYTTLRAIPIDWYTPIVDFMMCADGNCLFIVSGYNEDNEFVEIGVYKLETRDIERFQIILRYIMIMDVLRFHENNKISRTCNCETATITDNEKTPL